MSTIQTSNKLNGGINESGPLATGNERDLTSEAAKVYYKHLKEDIVSGYNGGNKL